MLRRTIAPVACLLMLSSMLAWAQADVVLEPASAVLADPHAESILDDGHCDHDCYAAAHLIALEPPGNLFGLRICSERFSVVRHVRLTTLYPNPPREPPRL